MNKKREEITKSRVSIDAKNLMFCWAQTIDIQKARETDVVTTSRGSDVTTMSIGRKEDTILHTQSSGNSSEAYLNLFQLVKFWIRFRRDIAHFQNFFSSIQEREFMPGHIFPARVFRKISKCKRLGVFGKKTFSIFCWFENKNIHSTFFFISYILVTVIF